MRGRVLIADIQREVARELKVPVSIMRDRTPTSKCGANPWPTARARQAAIALSVLLTEHSNVRIGSFFGGRDPTTVRHASMMVAKRRKTDPALHNALRRVTLALLMERSA
jgi:chromosomal replication initiator protein